MKSARFFWIVLSIILTMGGVRVLLDSIRHPGEYADELVLLGGTLSALGLVPMHLAFKQLLQKKAPARR